MGLSGRKVKQRIGSDPRNLGWADDAARFGSNYLSKFGWDASKGLGAGGDGMKTHIKVSHKLDMLGIGAAQSKDPNGIAWKQNQDFENLLQRLNSNLQEVEKTPAPDVTEENSAEGASDDGKKKRKRKHRDAEEDGGSKKKKKHGKEKKQGEDENSNPLSAQVESMQVETIIETETVVVQKVTAPPRHRAHRARAIAAKNIASKSAAHISEILGVAPNAQPVQSAVAVQEKPTSVTETDALGMDKLTTSTKSLADYFKDKLDARTGSSSGTASPTSARVESGDPYDAPRGGIGASRMRLEIQSETMVEEETQRVGILKFSSLMSSSFLAATSSIFSSLPQKIEQNEVIDDIEAAAHISEVESQAETRKKSKKSKEKKSKGTAEVDDERVEEHKVKKSKKDKKGKGKATEDVEEAEVDESGDRKRRKKGKKEKKTAENAANKVEDVDANNANATHKKEKKKYKSENSDDPSPQNIGKPKHKKKRQTDS